MQPDFYGLTLVQCDPASCKRESFDRDVDNGRHDVRMRLARRGQCQEQQEYKGQKHRYYELKPLSSRTFCL